MRYHIHSMKLAVGLLMATLFAVSGCPNLRQLDDDGDGEPNLPTGTVARIEIEPDSFLLTELGDNLQLRAKTYNAEGEQIAADLVWRSSNTAVLTVDKAGLAVAIAELGSAQVYAEKDGVESQPIMGVVAKPVDGAVLISDDDVVGEPAPVDPEADYGLGYRFTVKLGGATTPTPGDLLLNTGQKLACGRIIGAAKDGDHWQVTLEVVSPDEFFEKVRIDQAFDLSTADFEAPDDVVENYDVTVWPDGTVDFTPRPELTEKTSLRSQAMGTSVLFSDCSGTANFPLTFRSPPVVSLTRSLTLDFSYDSSLGGLQRFVLDGEAKATVNFSPTIALDFSGSYMCERELIRIPLPILPPWLRLIISPCIPIGVGIEAKGSLTATEIGFDVSGEAGFKTQLGVDCVGGPCKMVNTAELIGKPLETKPVFPSASAWTEQMAVAVSLQAYALAKVEIGNPFIPSLQFSAFELRAGPRFSLDLAHPRKQAENPNMASNYKLALVGEAGVGAGFQAFNNALNINVAELKFTAELPLAGSPEGAFTATPTIVQVDNDPNTPEPVDFEVKMANNSFLGLFEPVRGVELYRKTQSGSIEPEANHCGLMPAAAGQTDFACTAEFYEPNDVGTHEFYAFYEVSLFGAPLPFPFEVTGDSRVEVDIQEVGNIALNRAQSGYPHPLESDNGWGGGANKWELVDGMRAYYPIPDEWAHGLAFIPTPAGPRQATIDFGAPKTFSQVFLSHHGNEHVPAVAGLQYWDGSSWVDITFQRTVTADLDTSWSQPDIYDFAPVTGSKVRWTFNNSGLNILGNPIEHGWLYEFEVYGQ